jgi:hypothetical protein
MSATKPTVLVIHGAWHTQTHYEALKTHLKSLGYPVLIPQLPSCNNDIPPTSSLPDDITMVRQLATSLISSGKRVLALMHSYRGVVGTAALAGLAAPRDSPTSAGVQALIYMTAFVPHENLSLASMFADRGLPPFLRPNAETGVIELDNPGYHFYNDLPESEREQWTSKLVGHPISAQTTPIGDNCAWRDAVDVWYLVCEGDQALLPAVQHEMIEKTRKGGGGY